jgi:translation initiation factor 2B subunit (eIF-2B alpha/beta/delta family)
MELHLNKDFLYYYNKDLGAKTAVSTLHDISLSHKKNHLKRLVDTKNSLFYKHGDNAVLKNALTYLLHKFPEKAAKRHVRKKKTEILKKLIRMNKEVAYLGSKKIKPGSTVFVHSCNNQLTNIIVEAAKHKTFHLNLLPGSPANLGQSLAETLTWKKSNITLFPDLALKNAINSADVCFIGADIISEKGAVTKLGGNLCAEIARKNHVPLYLCAHSWKYDGHKTTKPTANNQLYEFIPEKKITAFLLEHGIFKPRHLQREIKLHNSWMFI